VLRVKISGEAAGALRLTADSGNVSLSRDCGRAMSCALRWQPRRSREARRIPALTSIPCGRLSECALESAIERRFRFVAHVGRDIRNSSRGRRQRLCSQTQSPSGQVRHWRIRQVAREARHQRRAGYSDARRELGDGPWVMRASVAEHSGPACESAEGFSTWSMTKTSTGPFRFEASDRAVLEQRRR